MEGTLEYGQELEFENFEFEDSEWSGEGEVFSEAELMELAGELMEVNSEAELDHFFRKAIKKAAQRVKKAVRAPLGSAVGSVLKGVAKKALPFAGPAVGGFFGGPLGANIGKSVAATAANAMELEQLEVEDKAFEGAKKFVQLSGDAVKSALSAPSNMNPQAVAQQAVVAAAAKHVPGLAGKQSPAGTQKIHRHGGPVTTGQWVRKGNKILIRL